MKTKGLVLTALILLALLVAGKLVLDRVNSGYESATVFTVDEIKYDDSTYRYVKERCDSGALPADSENCTNLRAARP